VVAQGNKSGGVFAQSGQGLGVFGLSTPKSVLKGIKDIEFGVFGLSDNGVGVAGYSPNGFGIYAEGATGPGGGAAYLNGDVVVTASVLAKFKNAIVPFPDGSQRLLHCMESPEHWFEDFGSARLARGRVVVKLDADFAKVVKLTDYRVFLTPEGECRGIYVRRKGGKTFEVRELQGGTSSVAFSYRIVGRRKDIKTHKRFATIDISPPLPSGRGGKRARPPVQLRTLLAKLEKSARRQTKKPAHGAPRDGDVIIRAASTPARHKVQLG
jgi:hypothetical protein